MSRGESGKKSFTIDDKEISGCTTIDSIRLSAKDAPDSVRQQPKNCTVADAEKFYRIYGFCDGMVQEELGTMVMM